MPVHQMPADIGGDFPDPLPCDEEAWRKGFDSLRGVRSRGRRAVAVDRARGGSRLH